MNWHGQCVCNIYVNKHGDVCLRQFKRGSPPGGTIFALAEWSNVKFENGHPYFQGVRGICAKIFSSQITTPQKNLSVITSFFKRYAFLTYRDRNLSIHELFLKRNQLYASLATLRRHQREECLKAENNSPREHDSDSSDDEDHNPMMTQTQTPMVIPLTMKSTKFKQERQKIKNEIKQLQDVILWKLQSAEFPQT